MENKTEEYAYIIPVWAIYFIEYQYDSSISDVEEQLIENFLKSLPRKGTGHFNYGDVDEEKYFCSHNDISGKGAECVKAKYIVINP